MATINEIRNVFTLDTGNFDKYMKSADTSVNNLKKSIRVAKKEVIELQKQFESVQKAIKGLSSIKIDIDTNTNYNTTLLL